MLNQHDDHSSLNPASQEEANLPTWDSIMDRLTQDEQSVVYAELYDRQAPMRKLKAIQMEIYKANKEIDDLQTTTFGGNYDKVAYNAEFSRLHNKKTELETKRDEIIKNSK